MESQLSKINVYFISNAELLLKFPIIVWFRWHQILWYPNDISEENEPRLNQEVEKWEKTTINYPSFYVLCINH